MQYLMANVAQQTVYTLRQEVEAKFDRLPLKFFDSRTRGEVMSRAVNDLDSISGTLQQNLTQLLTSVLTLVGVIVMMLTISWLLTLGIVLTLPLSLVIVARIAKRSQKFFMQQQGGARGAQWSRRRDVRRPHHRHRLRPRGALDRDLRLAQRQVHDGAWRAQFVSGIIMPTMMFVGNLGFVFVAVIGGLLVTRQAIAIGDIQAFIQYVRHSRSRLQIASISNVLQQTAAAAERVFEFLDEPEEVAETADAIGHRPSRRRGRVRRCPLRLQPGKMSSSTTSRST